MNSRWDILKPFEENKEYILKRTAEGIEKHRKGTARLRLTDAEGKILKRFTREGRAGDNVLEFEQFRPVDNEVLQLSMRTGEFSAKLPIRLN